MNWITFSISLKRYGIPKVGKVAITVSSSTGASTTTEVNKLTAGLAVVAFIAEHVERHQRFKPLVYVFLTS